MTDDARCDLCGAAIDGLPAGVAFVAVDGEGCVAVHLGCFVRFVEETADILDGAARAGDGAAAAGPSPCPDCHGRGDVLGAICGRCEGSGRAAGPTRRGDHP